jgi:hypothetical protein
MIAAIQPISGTFTASEYPRGKVFKQILESTPGTDSYVVNAVNIAFVLGCIPGVLLNVNKAYAALNTAALQIAEQEGLVGNAETLAKAAIVLAEKVVTFVESAAFYWKFVEEKSGGEGLSERQLRAEAQASKGNVEAAKLQVQTLKQELASLEAQQKALKVERTRITKEQQELGEKEALAIFHDFDPLTITAKLTKGSEEVLWMGTLTPGRVPSGTLKNELVRIAFEEYRMVRYDNTFLSFEDHIPIAPVTITGGEHLTLTITVTGPTEWKTGTGKSGVGIFKNLEEAGAEWFVIGGRGEKKEGEGHTEVNVVNILSSEFSLNYEHSP